MDNISVKSKINPNTYLSIAPLDNDRKKFMITFTQTKVKEYNLKNEEDTCYLIWKI